jgi:hypothetical protein
MCVNYENYCDFLSILTEKNGKGRTLPALSTQRITRSSYFYLINIIRFVSMNAVPGASTAWALIL